MKVTLMHSAIGEFSFPLISESRAVIGRRGADLDLELTWDARISRRHAAVWVDDGAVWYEDLGSRNGTWCGERRLLGPQRLEPGDSVLIGETALIVPIDLEEAVPLREVEVTHDHFSEEVVSQVEQVTAMLDLSTVRTEDLRTGQPTESAKRGREPRRIVDKNRVQVTVAGRDELRQLWIRDISKGGLFVEMDEAPTPGTRLIVQLATPGGMLSLNASVVHVVDAKRAAQYKIQPGAGLSFTDLDSKKRAAIRDYVDGISQALDADLAAPTTPNAKGDVSGTFETVKRILRQTEHDALYSALDLFPTASSSAITERITELFAELEGAVDRMSPPQAARVRAALGSLARIRRVLGSIQTRLEYDFRAGHVRARERIVLAQDGSGPSLSMLRRTWNRMCPDRVDQAALLTRQAFVARQSRDVLAAIEAGRRALELNPFFEELRKTVETWESFLKDEREQCDPFLRSA